MINCRFLQKLYGNNNNNKNCGLFDFVDQQAICLNKSEQYVEQQFS